MGEVQLVSQLDPVVPAVPEAGPEPAPEDIPVQPFPKLEGEPPQAP